VLTAAGLAALSLLLRPVGAAPPTGRAAELDRGRSLAEASGCADCHSPKDASGGRDGAHLYDGGWAAGWYAPALNAASPAVQPWTADALSTYLTTGLSLSHAAAAGPMGPVVRRLAAAPEADVRAMSLYFADLMASSPGARAAAAPPDHAAEAARSHSAGETLFAGACAACHEIGAPMMLEGRPALQLGTPLHEASPRDTIAIILRGLEPPVGRSGPYMPAFADDFSDPQLAELAGYLHARYGPEAAWPRDLTDEAASARREAR
jgi:nicotinate dehydrogenase subunit B